jgi:hypothetical protein
MQNASNQMCGDPWLKNGCATNSRPRFRLISFISFCGFFQCNFYFNLFLQTETPPAAQKNTFYESSKKDLPQAPLLSVRIVAKQESSPAI